MAEKPLQLATLGQRLEKLQADLAAINVRLRAIEDPIFELSVRTWLATSEIQEKVAGYVSTVTRSKN